LLKNFDRLSLAERQISVLLITHQAVLLLSRALTLPPGRVQSIVISMSVCMSVRSHF